MPDISPAILEVREEISSYVTSEVSRIYKHIEFLQSSFSFACLEGYMVDEVRKSTEDALTKLVDENLS